MKKDPSKEKIIRRKTLLTLLACVAATELILILLSYLSGTAVIIAGPICAVSCVMIPIKKNEKLRAELYDNGTE